MKIRYYLTAVAMLLCAGNLQTFANQQNYCSATIKLFQPPQGERKEFKPEEMAKQETKWMTSDLVLEKEQIPLVDSINFKYALKMSQMRKENKEQDREAMHAKMEELQKQKNEELKGVLSEAQMKKYIELLPQRRGPRGGQRPDGGKRPDNGQGQDGPKPEEGSQN
jgi:hypothetical protein